MTTGDREGKKVITRGQVPSTLTFTFSIRSASKKIVPEVANLLGSAPLKENVYVEGGA